MTTGMGIYLKDFAVSSVLSTQREGWGTSQSWGSEKGSEGLKGRHVVAI